MAKETEVTMTGGCACGAVRFEAEVDTDDAYLCHCRICQRATGSVSIAFKNLPQGKVRWLTEPDWYDSSPIARRPHCAACGTSLGFQYKQGPNIDLTVAAFDQPGRFKPASHSGTESLHEAWIDTSGLPRSRSEEDQPLVDRWIKATGSLPG